DEHRKQTRVPAAARVDQLKIYLRCRIERDKLRKVVATQRRQMIDLPPELMFQIMDDRASRADRGRHLRAAETVERFGFEMLAQCERGLFRQERITVVAKCVFELAQLLLLFLRD